MASATAPGLSPVIDGVAPPSIAASTAREHGRVRWFCADRGFGWVRAHDGTDVFMSFRDLPGSGFRCVAAGDRVSFVRDRDRHGTVARAVAVLAHPAESADPPGPS